jgi:hypothetical protein
VPSLCSRDSLPVTRFLVEVSSSSPIHMYRNISLRCVQPLLKGLTPCNPFPGRGVLLLTYTQVQKCQPPLCSASARGTHLMSPVSWWSLSSTPVHKYRKVSLCCVQSLLNGLTPCHPFPGRGVLLLTYTQVQKYQPLLCPTSARGTHSMSPVSWWRCPPPHLYTSTEMLHSLCCAQPLVKGLTTSYPFPGGGVLLLTYTQVQKC